MKRFKPKNPRRKFPFTIRAPLIKASLLLFLVSFFMACNNDDLKDGALEPDATNPLTERVIKNEEIEHRSNEMDNAGLFHNQFIDRAVEKGDFSKETLREVTKEFLAEKKVDAQEANEILKQFDRIYEQAAAEAPEIGGPVTEFLCDKYPWICEIRLPPIPFDILKLEEGSMTDRNLDFIKELQQIEEKTMNTGGIDPKEKEMALGMFAVARYSSAYWHNNRLALGPVLPDVEPEKIDIDVVWADVKGFAEGASEGGFWNGIIRGAVASVKRYLEKNGLALDDGENTGNSGNSGSLIDDKQMANGKNKMDVIGQMHNEFIAHYIGHYEKFDRETLRGAFEVYFKEDQSRETREVMAVFDEIFDGIEKMMIEIGPGPFNPSDDWNRCKYLPKFLCDLLYPSDPLPLLTLNGEGGSQFDRNLKFIEEVKSLEEKVLRAELEDNDKTLALGSFSVARYSSAYWYNYMVINGGNTGDANVQKIDGGTVLADIGGANVGGRIGAYFGPWGAVIGTVVGAAGGSLAYHYAS